MQANIDNVEVGTIIVHRSDDSYWYKGRRVIITGIDYNLGVITYASLSEETDHPDMQGRTSFFATGLHDFDIESSQSSRLQTAMSKFVRLQHLQAEVEKQQTEIDELKRELKEMLK